MLVSVPQTVVNGPWSHTALLLSCDQALDVSISTDHREQTLVSHCPAAEL